jgi:CHAT domain-containing protein
LYGLIRAFMYAGAPAIIAMLWRVDERSTLIFAEKFYQSVQQGSSYPAAFKEAQLYLKRLTRKAAADILTRHRTDAGVDLPGGSSIPAGKYRQSANTPHSHTGISDKRLLGETENDAIFADPKYWAPFVLIGDPYRPPTDPTR